MFNYRTFKITQGGGTQYKRVVRFSSKYTFNCWEISFNNSNV